MIDDATHVIQVALTPVFLLSAIAALLSVFSTRLGRVADRVHIVSSKVAELSGEGGRPDQLRAARLARDLAHLQRRSWHLDVAVVASAGAAGLTCLVILLIFFGTLGSPRGQTIVFGLFGLAVLVTLVSILAFVAELLLAGRGVRKAAGERQATAEVRSVRPTGAPLPVGPQAQLAQTQLAQTQLAQSLGPGDGGVRA